MMSFFDRNKRQERRFSELPKKNRITGKHKTDIACYAFFSQQIRCLVKVCSRQLKKYRYWPT